MSVSFGGAAGQEIADSCTSVSSLEAQYQSVASTYNLTHLDFDVEGKTLSNTQGNVLRNKAIAAMQARDPSLVISYTLPVNVTGLTQQAINLLKDAIKNGINISVVNIMTMDYYNKNAPGNQMGKTLSRPPTVSLNSCRLSIPRSPPAKSGLWSVLHP